MSMFSTCVPVVIRHQTGLIENVRHSNVMAAHAIDVLSASTPEKELVAADCVDCCSKHTMAKHFASSFYRRAAKHLEANATCASPIDELEP